MKSISYFLSALCTILFYAYGCKSTPKTLKDLESQTGSAKNRAAASILKQVRQKKVTKEQAPDYVKALKENLKDKDRNVRGNIAATLEELIKQNKVTPIEIKSLVPPLYDCVPGENWRQECSKCLATIGKPTVDFFAKMKKLKNPVMLRPLRLMGKRNPKVKTTPPIIALLEKYTNTKRAKVAIPDFINVSKDASYSWAASSLSGAIDESMKKTFLFDRTKSEGIQKALEKNLTAPGSLKTGTLSGFCKKTKSDYMLIGDYRIKDEKMLVQTRVFECKQKKFIRKHEETAAINNQIFQKTSAIADSMVASLKAYSAKDKKSDLVLKSTIVRWKVATLDTLSEAGAGELKPHKRTFAALLKEDDSSVQTRALYLLSKLGDVNLVKANIKKRIFDKEYVVRDPGFRAINMLGPNAAPFVGDLTKILRNRKSPSKGEAIRGLAAIGPKAAGAATLLKQKAYDPDHYLAMDAVDALTKIGPKGERALLALCNKPPENVYNFGSSLGTLGDKALPCVPKFLAIRRRYAKKRYSAASEQAYQGILGVVNATSLDQEVADKNRRYLDMLIKEKEHVSPAIQRLAILSLGNIKSKAALTRLEKLEAEFKGKPGKMAIVMHAMLKYNQAETDKRKPKIRRLMQKLRKYNNDRRALEKVYGEKKPKRPPNRRSKPQR